jgi:hypoxanthine phosphoribosyltransferase
MKVLIAADRIQARVAELARQVAADYGERPLTIVGVLTGSLIFLADLMRHLELPVRIGLIQASSYRGTATTPGELRVGADLLPAVEGRHVLLLDDILDTGRTLNHLVRHFQSLEVASLRVAVLLRKIGRQQVPLNPDYVGFEIPDSFVVGYGLDYNDEYRHLPHVAVWE